MQIRKANKKDMPAIRRLIRVYPEQLIQEHLPRAEEFFVAVISGSVAGCCALAVYSKRLAEVRSLAVHADHKGKGIATALIGACITAAKKKKIYEVLAVTGAKRLFESAGFGGFNKEKYALLKVLGK